MIYRFLKRVGGSLHFWGLGLSLWAVFGMGELGHCAGFSRADKTIEERGGWSVERTARMKNRYDELISRVKQEK